MYHHLNVVVLFYLYNKAIEFIIVGVYRFFLINSINMKKTHLSDKNTKKKQKVKKTYSLL